MNWTNNPDFKAGEWYVWKRFGENGVNMADSGWRPVGDTLYYGPIPEPVEPEAEAEPEPEFQRYVKAIGGMFPKPDGEWVRWSDVEPYLPGLTTGTNIIKDVPEDPEPGKRGKRDRLAEADLEVGLSYDHDQAGHGADSRVYMRDALRSIIAHLREMEP